MTECLLFTNIIYTSYLSQLENLIDAAGHSEHGILIRCDIGAELVERFELECFNVVNCN
jgi:hypothetical protein